MSTLRCGARNVRKRFGTTEVLRGVNLEIPEGDFAVLVGPSGCGKSTLLRIVAGLETPDEGTLTIAGRDVTELPPRDRDIAMVFQSYALYPHLTVRENLAFGLRLRKAPEATIKERIKQACDMLGLEPLLGRLPKELSGGQRQRVAMGRAIVRRASLYLFDEPLSNLDAALRAEVRVDIRKLHAKLGATSLYVTHDQTEAMTLADTLWVLNRGLVEQKGPPLDVYEHPQTKFVAAFLGSPRMNFAEARLRREGNAWLANADGISVHVNAGRVGEAKEGAKVTLAIRPHDVRIVKDTGEDAFGRLLVEVVEALGSEAFAYGTLERGAAFTARIDPDLARRVKPGDGLSLAASSDRVHLFDPVTERALDA